MYNFSNQLELSRDDFQGVGSVKRYTITLPSDKGDSITGIKVYESKEKTNEFSLGLSSYKEEVQALTYKEDWTKTTEYTKLKEIIVPEIAGRKMYIDVKAEELFVGNTTLHVVFIIEDLT